MYMGQFMINPMHPQGRSSTQQRGIIREILFSMLPPGASATFRMLFPPNK